MATLRLALAQLNVTVGDIEGNRLKIAGAIRAAAAFHADLVIVPELATLGYPPEDLLLKSHVVRRARASVAQLAKLARGLVALVGFVDQDRDALYNGMAVLAGGRHVATYHKQHLPNYGVFDEKRYFAAGTEGMVLQLGQARVGLTICEDLWMESPIRVLRQAGAQLIINISASPYHAGKVTLRERLFSRRAKANQVPIAHCNLVGGQDELVFDGASLVLNARGARLAHGWQFREDLLVVDVPLAATPVRSCRGVRVIRVPQTVQAHPPLPAVPRTLAGPQEEVYEALVLGTRDYVRKNGFTTVVLGLSGGIDSALTAAIAIDALGAAHVRALILPSRYSSQATQADARQVAARLGIQTIELSIEPMLRASLQTLRPVFGRRRADTTEQNLQARIRGLLLMACSNKFGWLVLTTGNKSEMATGYCTLYGDMAGGFAVIKDVPKTLVYQLARYRNARGPKTLIPARVFTRAPTAELAPHQRDQDDLPPYAQLDRILQAYIEQDLDTEAIMARTSLRRADVARVIRMVDRSEYKRRQSPPGVKITPKALGRDRRMPITNKYSEKQ